MQDLHRHTDMFDAAEAGEFMIRRRLPNFIQLLILFCFCFGLLYGIATNAESLGGDLIIALAIFAIIGPLSWFTIYHAQHNRDMLLAAEFQNALFSAAARVKSKFCMIAKQDGTVVYFDRDFQNYFPETANRGVLMVDKILTGKHITPSEADKLAKALANNEQISVIITVPQLDGKELRMVITTDPLPRPSGFILLRGREYVTKQYAKDDVATGALPNNSPASNSLVHLLHTAPVGLYITDSAGKIQFANYTLEGWLGYNQHEILGEGKLLRELVNDVTHTLDGKLLAENVSGEVQMLGKNGALIPLHLQQEVVTDKQGNVTSTAAMLFPLETAPITDEEMSF